MIAEQPKSPPGLPLLVIRPGEPSICFGIDSVVDVGPIDADQNTLSASLHGDLRCGAQRDLCYFQFIGCISLRSVGRLGACQQRRKSTQKCPRLQYAAQRAAPTPDADF